MKKAVIVFLFVKLCVSVFGQEYVLTDTASYDYFVKIPKGEVLTGISEIIEDCTIGENSIPYNLRSSLQYKGDIRGSYIDTDLLVPKDTIDVFDSEITFSGLFAKNKILVHENQIEILNHPVAYLETFKKYYPKEYDYYIINSYDNDIDILYRNYITNAVINLRSPNIDYDISILNIIKQDKNKYTLDCKAGHFTKQDKYTEKYINKNTLFTITLTIDGDYFIFSSDKFETEKFVVVDIEAEDFYYKVMNGQSVDLSNFNWPKHADGSCTITKESESDVIELPVKEEQRILVDQYSQDPELKEYYLYRFKHNSAIYYAPALEEINFAKNVTKGTIVKYIRVYKDEMFGAIPSKWIMINTDINESHFLIEAGDDKLYFCAASDLELIEDQDEPREYAELAEEERRNKEYERKQNIKKLITILLPLAFISILVIAIIVLVKKRKKNK